jgi:16S rRNA G527 N7-methylase RsmG
MAPILVLQIIHIMIIKITFFHCPLVRELQLQNVDIIVADISTFEMEASYDRIFSIEMFEVRFCG